jgi:predicted metal-dependent enzyme (double-stranded beta helix superfamily)
LTIIDATRARTGLGGLIQLVRSAAANPDQWAGVVRYRAGQRWYQRLAQAEDHELWLLSWLPGQRTGFHDHLGSAGAFAVVLGTLEEHTAAHAGVSAAALGTGQVRAFGPRHVHDVVNASAGRAVSIHAYSPVLAGMRRYDLTPAGLVLTRIDTAKEDW